MKILFSRLKYLFICSFFFSYLTVTAEEIRSKNASNNKSQILIESNTQRSDLENSIFYAEGDVRITNTDNEFYAKSKKAIFYKLNGVIKLIGDAEVITTDASKIIAGEIFYYLEENKFEANSDLNQRVNTKFNFNKKKTNQLPENN